MAQCQISDEVYLSYANNPDIKAIIKSVSLKYQKSLDENERDSVSSWALLRCIKGHKADMGNKFTTSLVTYLYWEFNRALKTHRKQTGYGRVLWSENDVSEELEVYSPECKEEREVDRARLDYASECLKFLPAETAEVVRLNSDGFSVAEVAELMGIERTRVRKMLNGGISRLRDICTGQAGAIEE